MTSSVWRIGIEAVQGGNPNDPVQTQEADIAIDDVRLLWPSCESKMSNVPVRVSRPGVAELLP